MFYFYSALSYSEVCGVHYTESKCSAVQNSGVFGQCSAVQYSTGEHAEYCAQFY